jgi:hypothetical protein
MKVKKHIKVLAATIGLIASTTSAAFAGFNNGDAVTMNGQDIFHIKGSAEGFSPDRRAWQAQDALDNALFVSNNRTAAAVNVARVNGAYVLQLDGHYIATADESSAQAEGIAPQALANSWADSLRTALFSSQNVEKYVATLKTPNQLQGDIASTTVEKRVFAPEGTTLPVVFNQTLNSKLLTNGQGITGRVTRNVPLGNYMIPGDSEVTGSAVETKPGFFQIRVSSLRTPNGTEVPLNAVLTSREALVSTAPHPVATIGMPANSTTGTRIPALIGIGCCAPSTYTAMTLSSENGDMIASGRQATVILEKKSSVAVIPSGMAM